MPIKLSWVESANDPETGFPLNNLPCGVFSPPGGDARCGVAIGAHVLDLRALENADSLGLGPEPLFAGATWNAVMARGPALWSALRARLTDLLATGAPDQAQTASHLHALGEITLHLPVTIAEFTDFYANRHHATNVGTMFRGAENALPPNWMHIPIGYNGRASTVVVSGTGIRRPNGQIKPSGQDTPLFGPSRKLDFELEIGALVGTGSSMGSPVSVDTADAMIFGYVLLNDWSARDIQAWEYQPLGPFQAKAFATTIGPWIVTAEALAPFRCAPAEREVPLLPYLRGTGPTLFDIDLAVDLACGDAPFTTIARTNYNEMSYSAAQQLAHHASSGCAMRTGDLLGSGTISGSAPDQRGCLLEMTWNGTDPLHLPNGSERTYLEDGDRVRLRGHAQGDSYRIDFGSCVGTVAPAVDFP